MKHILTAAALALVTAAPSYALTQNQAAIVLNGVASHGSVVCNPSWLDRPGSYTILAGAKAAHADPKTVKTLLVRGMTDFDRKVRELGKAGACQQLNQVLNEMGG